MEETVSLSVAEPDAAMEDDIAGASAAAPLVMIEAPLTPAAVYPPIDPIQLEGPATFSFSDANTPGPLTANKFETGAAPLIDMAEPELVSLLQEGFAGLRRLTPRTLEACEEEGLDPIELLPRVLSDFAPRDLKVHLPRHHQEARFQRFEERRVKKLGDVVSTRRRLIAMPPPAMTVEEAANHSVLVEERRRRAEESMAAARRQERILLDQLKAQEQTSLVAAQRAEEAENRKQVFERVRAAALLDKQEASAQKREVQEARINHRKAEAEAEHARRAAAAAEHEASRAQRLEEERAVQNRMRHAASVRKQAKAEAANNDKTLALQKRKVEIEEMIAERQVRVDLHAKQVEEDRIQHVKEGIERHEKVDRAVGEVDLQELQFAAKTLEMLESKSKGTSVRDELMAQRQRLQAARGKAASASRLEVDRQRDRAVRKLVQEEEKKEHKRQLVLASRASELSDHAEKRRAKLEELEERVRRQTRKREYERECMRAAQKKEDAKFFAQRAALDQVQRERAAQKHKMEADGKIGDRVTMRELDAQAEPGPTNYDNRFYTTGQLGPNGKWGRVGTKPAPPAWSFGNFSEHALPRVLDKSLMIELVGQISPGPNTAHAELGSREVLDKSSRYPRSPSWSMGHQLEVPFTKEALAKPGPGETHVSDKQLELTRYHSAPSFAFASSNYQELRARELAAMSRPATGGELQTRERTSFDHPSRLPGPCSYDHGQVQTSLRHHRTLKDGMGVSQRFAKADRFLPIDTDPKDIMGPTKYVKSKNVPGPQKYRPNTSSLSTPLKF